MRRTVVRVVLVAGIAGLGLGVAGPGASESAARAAAKPAPGAEEAPLDPKDAEANLQRGLDYVFGRYGHEKDPAKGVEYLRVAAGLGHPRAQTQMGMAYLYGRGVTPNIKEAIRWLSLAAEQNHPKAQLELALAHRDGRGVEKDPVRAMMWFILASDQSLVPRLVGSGYARQLEPEQRREALEAARDWREAHGLPRLSQGKPIKARYEMKSRVVGGPGGAGAAEPPAPKPPAGPAGEPAKPPAAEPDAG